jgi:hypothetical protein
MRKLLHRFEHPWQAEIFQGLLKQEGIESVQLRGAREYASIVTGIGDASVEVFVEEADLTEAQKVLSQYLKKTHLHIVEDVPERGPAPPVNSKGSFGKIVFFSVAGAVLLPVILNIFAVYHLFYFLKGKEETLFSKMVAVSIVVAGWAGSVALIYVTLTHLLNY